MAVASEEILEKKVGKELYDYQKHAIDQIFTHLEDHPDQHNILYQLPTGGGKTVIFSEIARRYIKDKNKKVLILTHRIELSAQTSNVLTEFGVKNMVINSKVKELEENDEHMCYVAMVETLNNRLRDEKVALEQVGMVIVDEAHYNSFRKLFKFFENCIILGVTATPLSSNIKLPMNANYDVLIVGDSIASLIEKKFLAKANTYSYNVGLQSLKIGSHGDYTVSSSDRLYSSYLMQGKLLHAYEEQSKGKKTLIFNNGIKTSLEVHQMFKDAGYEIRHLDNTNSMLERREILQWFKEKPDAILTSVSILTTGFDEPTVDTIILNRATKSLTLYHQMIGRGSRIIPNKDEFTVIDLGNNALRFGPWDSYVDWYSIFRYPTSYLESLSSDEEIESHFVYSMPDEIRARFANTDDISFDMKAVHKSVMEEGLRPKIAIERSMEQHIRICIENSTDLDEAMELLKLLEDDIEYRIRNYTHCISKTTEDYTRWLQQDYKRKLSLKLLHHY